MTSLKRRFLVIMGAIVLTLSLGAFAIPAVPVEADSPNAIVQFCTSDNYNVSGDSFTNGQVTGTENWFSQLNVAGMDLQNVNLNLASSKSFDNFGGGPTPSHITGSTGAYNYEWDFGTVSAGGVAGAQVGLNNNPVTFTPGFNAKISADSTTFTASGTQILTVTLTPVTTLPDIGIVFNVPQSQSFTAIVKSVTTPDGAPLDNYGISADGSNVNININNPSTNTTYIYQIKIQLTLPSGVNQLEFMPSVCVNTYLPGDYGSVASTSVQYTNGAGTWNWSSDDSRTWNWSEGISRGVNFQGYSTIPSTTIGFGTVYAYGAPGDSFTNELVTGNEGWSSAVGANSIALSNLDLDLTSNTKYDSMNPTPNKITPPSSSSPSYDYQWGFGGIPAGSGAWAGVGLNNSPITFKPGFDASRSADYTTFSSNGTQTLTVSFTPEEAIPNISINVNVWTDQYVTPTIKSVVALGGAPLNNYGINNGSANINISSPTQSTTYKYTITIDLKLAPGVTQLQYMPSVGFSTYQPGTSGSITGSSVTSPTTDVGTWKWSSNESITWNWNEGLSRGVNFSSYETPTLTTATTISGGGASVSQNDGVTVGITGSTAPSGTGVNISSTNYGSTQPSGTGAIQLTGSPPYYDVKVNSSSGLGTGATARISITNPGVTSNSLLQYWYNNQWNTAINISVSGNTITGDIPVAALGGTPIAIGNDAIPPVIIINAPINGGVYYLNQAVNANWSVTDVLAGIASSSGTVTSGSPINTGKVGSYSFTVSAKDNAGNTATSTVNYSVCGNAVTALSGNINIGNSTNVISSPGLSIGGNLLANGNISLGNTVKINGNATASASITKGNNDVVSGTSKANAGVVSFLTANTSAYLAAVQMANSGTTVNGASYANGGTISNAQSVIQGNYNLNNSKTLTVNGSLYVGGGSITIGNSSALIINGNLYIAAGSLTAGNSSKITVTGTVYVSGNLQAGDSATLSLGTIVWVGGGITLGNGSILSGPQTIVAKGSIMFGNTDVIGNPQMPLIISTNGGISLGNSDQLSGYLYAPAAGASIGNSVNVTGSIIATSVTIGNSCLITYGGN